MKKITTIIVICLSFHAFGQCWQSVSGGLFHSNGVKTDGTLWGWGLCNGQYAVPTKIGNSNDWQSVSCGRDYTVATKNNGTLWGWGFNYYCQLGVNTGTSAITYNINSPRQIGADSNWKSVAAGAVHIVAIKLDGTIWAMGGNAAGTLGNGTNIGSSVMVQIGTDSDWESVSAKGTHTIAKKTDGTIWTWGNNYEGQLGDGTNINRNVPTQIGIGSNWQSVAAGLHHTIAIKTDGTLWAWGYNYMGQLGDGTNVNKNLPTQIGISSDWQIAAGGDNYTVVRKTDGSIRLWGNNASGQLGYFTTPINADWQIITCGSTHNLFIKNDGSLWVWGNNPQGQLGNGTYATTAIPVNISCPLSLGIDGFEDSTGMTVYPNPVKNGFKITNAERIVMIRIYDIKGAELISLSENLNGVIDVSNLKQGIYLLKMMDDQGNMSSKRLIKE